ncbi:MAG: Tetratricopeptide repeat [Phycisphaerales bacterium]|nr:Tetratricopeptide repeat [Phycisphaerales bacterium]
MITSFLHRFFRITAAAGLLGVAIGTVGCADMMTDTRATRSAGIKLYNDGQYADAAGAFRNTVRAAPYDYGSHYYLGASLEHLGSYEQAISEYKTTLEIMTSSLEGKEDTKFRLKVVDSLASAIVKAQARDAEIAAINKAPASAENQFILAKIGRRSGDADAAIESYSRASNMAPRDFAIAKEFGLYLDQLGQTERARKELRRAYALNSQDDEVANALRHVGVVPGPSLKDESDLARPLVPVGPLPELQLSQPQPNDNGQKTANTGANE